MTRKPPPGPQTEGAARSRSRCGTWMAGPKHRVRQCYYAPSCEALSAILGLHRSGCPRVRLGQSGGTASSDRGHFGGSDLLLLVPSACVVRSSHARRDAVPEELVGVVDGLQPAAAQVAASSDSRRAPCLATPEPWPLDEPSNGARDDRDGRRDHINCRPPHADPVQLILATRNGPPPESRGPHAGGCRFSGRPTPPPSCGTRRPCPCSARSGHA
jgi:hypothetical protein